MERLGPAAVWRNGPFRLNPGKYLREMEEFNPRIPLGAAGLPRHLQQAIHDSLLEGEQLTAMQQPDTAIAPETIVSEKG